MPRKNILVPMVPAVLSLLLVLGVLTAFSACGPKDGGGWMRCHDCQNAVAASGGGLAVLFGAAALVRHRAARVALLAAATIGSVVVFFIPGGICPLCMMRTMRCYTIFQPFVRVMAGLVAASGAGALVWVVRQAGPASSRLLRPRAAQG